ncbi:MAG: response regulator [Candidatus Cloacimonadales bacterium]
MSPQKKKILIVEDELIIANDIRGYLTEENFDITSVVLTGKDAIAEVKKQQPDLVIMDILLHGEMNGIEAAEAIVKLKPIPIVFVSAYSHEEIVHKILSDVNYEYVLKPFQSYELISKINLVLQNVED